jgi:hypothetical protein
MSTNQIQIIKSIICFHIFPIIINICIHSNQNNLCYVLVGGEVSYGGHNKIHQIHFDLLMVKAMYNMNSTIIQTKTL